MPKGSKKNYIKGSTKPEGEGTVTEMSKYFEEYSCKGIFIGLGFKSHLSHM